MESNSDSFLDHQIPVAWQGEMMLCSWGDSSRNGRTATFRLSEDEPEHPFRTMPTQTGKTPGQRFMVVMVLLDDEDKPVKEAAVKPYGMHARQLHIAGWFFNRRVIEAFGSMDDYASWLSTKPCCVCKAPPPSNVIRGRQYSSVPVCNQHRHADESVLASHIPKLVKTWVDHQICVILGVDSLGNLPPEILRGLCRKHGIEDTLPKSYFKPE